MITQNFQNHHHTEVIAGLRSSVDRLIRILIERINTYRQNQSRRELYSYYQKFTIEQLHDIGMGNPQDQLRTLDRYLKAGTIDLCGLRAPL